MGLGKYFLQISLANDSFPSTPIITLTTHTITWYISFSLLVITLNPAMKRSSLCFLMSSNAFRASSLSAVTPSRSFRRDWYCSSCGPTTHHSNSKYVHSHANTTQGWMGKPWDYREEVNWVGEEQLWMCLEEGVDGASHLGHNQWQHNALCTTPLIKCAMRWRTNIWFANTLSR